MCTSQYVACTAAAYETVVASICFTLETLFQKLRKEFDQVVKQLAQAKKQLEEETLRRVQLENSIQSLKEQLDFLKTVHEQVKVALLLPLSQKSPYTACGAVFNQFGWQKLHIRMLFHAHDIVCSILFCFCLR